MRTSCRWCGLLGLCISALFHLSVWAAILGYYDAESADSGSLQEVPVTLAMFEMDSGPETVASASDEKSATSPQPAPEPEPASEPETEPEALPEPKPVLEPEPVAEPEPTREPKREITAESLLQPKPKPKPKPRPKRAEKPKPKPTRVTRRPSRQAAKNGGATTRRTATAARAKGSKGSSKGSRARRDAVEKEYLAGLQRAIARKRYYPQSARRTGKTGVATVAFVLDRSGRISDARLAKSSGSGDLDRAAVETLRRLARYKPIPQALGRTRWPLRVPIRFALK